LEGECDQIPRQIQYGSAKSAGRRKQMHGLGKMVEYNNAIMDFVNKVYAVKM